MSLLILLAGCINEPAQAPARSEPLRDQPAVASPSPEEIDWQAADSAGTIATYAAFLQKYPQTTHLRVDTTTFAVGHFAMVSISNSVAAGPNGEIIPQNFQTVVTCEVIKDGQGTGEVISLDEAQKRGFVKRDPNTGLATAVFKKVQKKLYKWANDGPPPIDQTASLGVFVGDLDVVWEQGH